MKTIIQILFVSLLFSACNPIDEPLPEATFTLNIAEFQISTEDYTNLKNQEKEGENGFKHKYPICKLSFSNSDNTYFHFNSDPLTIDNFSITLPIGDYSLSGEGGISNAPVNEHMALTIPKQDISIEELTTEVSIAVEPTCTLLLITDENNLLDTAYINAPDTPLIIEDTYRYSYFVPKEGNHIYLIKKDSNSLDFLADNLEVGMIYKIIVSDDGTTQSLKLNPDFTVSDPITW